MGIGVEVNYEESMFWFEKSAAQGHAMRIFIILLLQLPRPRAEDEAARATKINPIAR